MKGSAKQRRMPKVRARTAYGGWRSDEVFERERRTPNDLFQVCGGGRRIIRKTLSSGR